MARRRGRPSRWLTQPPLRRHRSPACLRCAPPAPCRRGTCAPHCLGKLRATRHPGASAGRLLLGERKRAAGAAGRASAGEYSCGVRSYRSNLLTEHKFIFCGDFSAVGIHLRNELSEWLAGHEDLRLVLCESEQVGGRHTRDSAEAALDVPTRAHDPVPKWRPVPLCVHRHLAHRHFVHRRPTRRHIRHPWQQRKRGANQSRPHGFAENVMIAVSRETAYGSISATPRRNSSAKFTKRGRTRAKILRALKTTTNAISKYTRSSRGDLSTCVGPLPWCCAPPLQTPCIDNPKSPLPSPASRAPSRLSLCRSARPASLPAMNATT